MTTQQTTVLTYLRTRRPNRRWCGRFMIAARCDIPQAGATRTLASLVRAGLVERSVAGGVTFYAAL
jgi:DNA-binding MarR family transcriptional regulator